jgi:hypothetical protein
LIQFRRIVAEIVNQCGRGPALAEMVELVGEKEITSSNLMRP